MEIKSPAFKNNGFIPDKYTCDGENINPELNIENIPAKAKSLALIVDDPDSPSGTFVHWVLYDIVPRSTIMESAEPGKKGLNDFNDLGYGGPCPHIGTHHYVFKVYALDIKLNLTEGLTKKQLMDAMQEHILEKAELIGLYSREIGDRVNL